jgi:hypothetical protein
MKKLLLLLAVMVSLPLAAQPKRIQTDTMSNADGSNTRVVSSVFIIDENARMVLFYDTKEDYANSAPAVVINCTKIGCDYDPNLGKYAFLEGSTKTGEHAFIIIYADKVSKNDFVILVKGNTSALFKRAASN